jgi:hypothetical protein
MESPEMFALLQEPLFCPPGARRPRRLRAALARLRERCRLLRR